jgi:hypothetical protein
LRKRHGTGYPAPRVRTQGGSSVGNVVSQGIFAVRRMATRK